MGYLRIGGPIKEEGEGSGCFPTRHGTPPAGFEIWVFLPLSVMGQGARRERNPPSSPSGEGRAMWTLSRSPRVPGPPRRERVEVGGPTGPETRGGLSLSTTTRWSTTERNDLLTYFQFWDLTQRPTNPLTYFRFRDVTQ